MAEIKEGLASELKKLADIVNQFKTESVQVIVVEALLPVVLGNELKKTDRGPVRSQRRAARRKAMKEESDETKTGVEGKDKRAKPRRRGGTLTPGAALARLIEDDYFKDRRRTINDIIAHCRKDLATTFKPNELSSPLARAKRSKKLEREENKDGIYEYWTE